MSYLRHAVTGEIYPYNEGLLRRGDFEQFETLVEAKAGAAAELEAPVEKPVTPKGSKKAAKKVEVPAVEAPEPPAAEVPEAELGTLASELDDLLGGE